jgi:hypothetical protein
MRVGCQLGTDELESHLQWWPAHAGYIEYAACWSSVCVLRLTAKWLLV